MSISALRANAALLDSHTPVALSHDAWGHGEAAVAEALRASGLTVAAPGSSSGAGALATLYGLPGSHGAPALRLVGTVLSVKPLLAGEGVSYGYTHRADTDTRVALVTGGYAQGIVRALGNHAAVAIAGERRPIVGRVAMDVCVVDVGDVRVERGDEVVFFGDPASDEPSLGDWVLATGLTAAEIITTIGQRATREYTE